MCHMTFDRKTTETNKIRHVVSHGENQPPSQTQQVDSLRQEVSDENTVDLVDTVHVCLKYEKSVCSGNLSRWSWEY